MPNLLDVFAIPRGQKSRTRKLKDAFTRAYLAAHPDANHIRVDLAHEHQHLPVFDEWDIEAKFEMAFGEGKLDDQMAQRWSTLTQLTDQLHLSDLLVVSCPMWNFSVPWMMKRWIDCVVQGRLTFEARDGQYKGLLSGRPAVILATRDGDFRPGTPFESMDFHVPYLKTVLGFLGYGPIHTIVAEPLMGEGPYAGAAALEQAIAGAESLGQRL